MSNTVHVKNIDNPTTDKQVRDFFSFCGKISNLSVDTDSDGTKSATVTFEKETAAKTALLLDNTQLGAAHVHVTSGSSPEQSSSGKTATGSSESAEHEHIEQEDKPRSRIVAEYLAHGYVISDKAIEQALALDKQHGVSNRFMTALSNFDNKYKATEKAQAVDNRFGVTSTAAASWQGLNSYFEKAVSTPTGQKLRQFYETGNKQVMDVHNEARHLADLKGGKSNIHSVGDGKTKCNCGSDTGKCPCAPGTCACSNCAKNPEAKTTDVTPESAQMEVVSNDGKTKCNCGGNTGVCPCEAGKCACHSCAKNKAEA